MFKASSFLNNVKKTTDLVRDGTPYFIAINDTHDWGSQSHVLLTFPFPWSPSLRAPQAGTQEIPPRAEQGTADQKADQKAEQTAEQGTELAEYKAAHWHTW